tara:strand:- start:1470 stop:1598 length:129 start_codon:yes stop_codon:yes gene_type:complete
MKMKELMSLKLLNKDISDENDKIDINLYKQTKKIKEILNQFE